MGESKRQWGKLYYLRYDQEMEWYLTEPEEFYLIQTQGE